MNNKPNNLFW